MKKLLHSAIFFIIGLVFASSFAQVGQGCNNAIVIDSLPYSTTDDTANYGDNLSIEGVAGTTGCGGAGAYLDGNDVVYSFTASSTGTINIAMTPTALSSGIFVYDSCANIGLNCLAGSANQDNNIRNFTLQVTIGVTYYIVISTSLPVQTTSYTLNINYFCNTPSGLSVTNISSTSAQFSWVDSNASSSWLVVVQPAGGGNTIGTEVTANSNSNFLFTGLTPATNYQFSVSAVCDNGNLSSLAGPFQFSTIAEPPVCGGFFYDNGGLNGNYADNSDTITTICPFNSAEKVTVTFTSFNTEATWDGLYVFDGNSITSPQISSMNPIGNIPGNLEGAFWGNLTGANLPGPFTSSSPDGCLTFRFRSDSSSNKSGWAANVDCATPPIISCAKPFNLITSNITSETVTLGWTDTNAATSWEILALPFGSPAPLNSISGQLVTSNPATISGLTSGTIYSLYVKSICSNTDSSNWSNNQDANTLISNDECSNAIVIPVNNGSMCQLVTYGSLIGATASNANSISSPCLGAADDDVWFKFVAISPIQNISFQYISGSGNNSILKFSVYYGNCNSLTQVFCSNSNSGSMVNGFTVGTTY